MKRLALAVLATAVVGVAPAQAQTCIGYTPFSVGTLRLGGDLTFADHATEFGATGAFGSAVPGLFGSVSVAGIRYDGDASATLLDFSGGYSVPAKSLPSLEFCPVASFSHQFGPNEGGVNTSANNFSFGAALGRSLVATPTMNIVPFADLRFVHTSVSVDSDLGNFDGSDNYGSLGLGAGLVFNRTVTLRPAVVIPIALENGSTIFQISLAFNIGGR